MRTMTYTCGTTQHRVVDLIAPDGIMVNRIESLRTHAWDVELAAHGIDSAALNASTVQLEAKCADLTMLDTASNLFDADIRALASTGNRNKAGTITVDGWAQAALITGIEPSQDLPNPAKYALTVALLDGVWRKPADTQHFLPDELQSGLYLGYPYDYPYDYKAPTRGANAINTTGAPMPFKMVIFGPCTNPSITIGGNRYELTMTIPIGAYVTIDSQTGHKTITMTGINGGTTNVFDKATRGTGLDGGRYIFQPIPAGETNVQWNGFGWDLTIIMERSAPAWLTS